MNLIRLTEPYNVGELIMLQSLLEGSGIAYMIRHANISSLYPDCQVSPPTYWSPSRIIPAQKRFSNA